MEELNEILKQLRGIGEEVLETAKHQMKLSTLFDIYTEKVIPTFVSENELKEYYKKRMEEVNNLIYNI